nr:DMT family transporter [Planosporangium flavigriseum]
MVLAVFVGAVATLFAGVGPATAAPVPVTEGPSGLCTTDEWRNPANFDKCVGGLKDLSQSRIQCVQAPTPGAPDSGMAGWFASPSDERLRKLGKPHLYTDYGYAGYDYTTYDIGCAQTVMHPDYKFENTVANGEFMVATAIIGASNALRERAWDPKTMWGWADPLVEKATKGVYDRVFTVFGAITLAVIGLYLLWRSRQSDMSSAMTTAGWAVLVMVVVTALAHWPTWSANIADKTLIGSLNVIHEAVGPPSDVPQGPCPDPAPGACDDHRPPAVRASDTAAEGMLYRNWLRGTLGSADSQTAQKYGLVLYDAKSFSWGDIKKIREHPDVRQANIDRKQKNWMKVAEQIKEEDPEAYEYLQGTKGMERIGAGFIAILASLFFAMFDIIASILVLLGFLIFRWAVIATPILGTVGLLRPAAGGLRRLANAVVAAIFNIIIFGTGAAIYLFAVDLVMSTASLPGWLQVVLIWLTGVVGWLLLRPYRRITQLGGKDSSRAVTSVGSWHRLFFRDVRTAAALKIIEEGGTNEPVGGRGGVLAQTSQRPESRSESVVAAGGSGADVAEAGRPERTASPEPATSAPAASQRRRAEGGQRWTEPDVVDGPPTYTVYRPDSGDVTVPANSVHRPESAPMPR